jgi:hypothetical protein
VRPADDELHEHVARQALDAGDTLAAEPLRRFLLELVRHASEQFHRAELPERPARRRVDRARGRADSAGKKRAGP